MRHSDPRCPPPPTPPPVPSPWPLRDDLSGVDWMGGTFSHLVGDAKGAVDIRRRHGGGMCVGGCGWGNPWLISDRLPRATAVTLFARYLLSTPSHIARARLELRGRELACSSGHRGRLCHGHVLAEVANYSQQRLEQLAAWAAACPPVASPPTAPAPPKWWTERKPTVQERARSGAVCASCDASGGCYTFEVAFDMKKWFHQWFLRTRRCGSRQACYRVRTSMVTSPMSSRSSAHSS